MPTVGTCFWSTIAVCMYVCTYVCMCIHICMSRCHKRGTAECKSFISTYMYIYIHTYIPTYMYIYIHTYMSVASSASMEHMFLGWATHIYTYTMYVYICTSVYMHTLEMQCERTHIYISSRMYVCMYVCVCMYTCM